MKVEVRSLVVGVAAILVSSAVNSIPALAQSDWQDVADEHAEQIADEASQEAEDNPAWEQYAFTLERLSADGELSFIDLARDGIPFVLFFWISDCPLCHLQLPQVQQLQETIDDQMLDLRLVAINLDPNATAARLFYEEKGATFELLFDPRARYTDEAYHLNELGCPLTYVFDSNGELVDYMTGYRAQLETAVLRMLDIEIPGQPQVR
jgi:cytochrome oxidase Cu insertion factor (SCO1/SenC/PrrC family)